MRSQTIIALIILIIKSAITTKYLDMTYQLHQSIPFYPTLNPFEMILLFNGTRPDGYWYQADDISTTVHIGTHLDAPCHFARGRWCIHEIPFERLMLPAVVIDITEKAANDSDAYVTIEDLENWENVNGKIPNASALVLRSGWGKYWTDKEKYLGTLTNDSTKLHYPGLSAEAAQWIVDNTNIYAYGVDTVSLDRGQSIAPIAHTILLSENIYGIENMANVDKLPVKGAKIFAMPINIRDGSGAPARVYAELPDDM